MRIIGIDPGVERTGFAILEMASSRIALLDYGCIVTNRKLPFSHRLSTIAADLKTIIRQWKPVAAGLEQVFFSKNVKTALAVAHSRGVIIELLEEHGIPVHELNPSHIKLAVTGDSRADKHQIKKMLQYTLGNRMRDFPRSDDSADAIACGICLLVTHDKPTQLSPQP